MINNNELECVTQTKCLGVVIDNTLSFKIHAESIVKAQVGREMGWGGGEMGIWRRGMQMCTEEGGGEGRGEGRGLFFLLLFFFFLGGGGVS